MHLAAHHKENRQIGSEEGEKKGKITRMRR